MKPVKEKGVPPVSRSQAEMRTGATDSSLQPVAAEAATVRESFSTDTDVLSILDGQYEDYLSIQRVSAEQSRSIAHEDVPELEASFGRMHRLMDRIRLRQLELPGNVAEIEARDAEVARRMGALRELIRCLLRDRQANEASVRQLMDRTRAELKQFGQGQRAAKGYRSRSVEDARFFDGTR